MLLGYEEEMVELGDCKIVELYNCGTVRMQAMGR